MGVLVCRVVLQNRLSVLDRARVLALGARHLRQSQQGFLIRQTILLARGQDPLVVEIGEQIAAVQLEIQVVEPGSWRNKQRVRLPLELNRIDPEWKVRRDLNRLAIDEQQVIVRLPADDRERVAQRIARLLVGGIAPDERGEFFARVGFRMHNEKSQERFDPARRQRNRLRVALTPRADHNRFKPK